MAIPCIHEGKKIGQIGGRCDGYHSVHECHHESVRAGSGLAVRALRNAAEGSLKTDLRDDARRGRQYIVYPYTAKLKDQGQPPLENWVFACAWCPFRREPPECVQQLYSRLADIRATIDRYESATPEDRQAIAAELGDGPDDLQLSSDRV